MDYSKLSDFEINLQVNRALGMKHYPNQEKQIVEVFGDVVIFDPCNKPADAWPIILENKICLRCKPNREDWDAFTLGPEGYTEEITYDKNPLRAAMIIFLVMQEESANVQDNPA